MHLDDAVAQRDHFRVEYRQLHRPHRAVHDDQHVALADLQRDIVRAFLDSIRLDFINYGTWYITT